MAPAVIGLAPLQINVLINTYFASSLAEGSLSWLSYAFRLFWLPVGLFGVALSTATLPVIARYAALKDMDNLRETYASSLTLAFSLTIPASVGLMLLGEPITRVIFQHGSFDSLATVRTAEALSCYAVGLFAYSSVKIMVPVFYALDETRYPVLGSFLTMAVNVLLVWLTIGFLQHKALALSISCAMILNFFLSTVLYRKPAIFLRYLLPVGQGFGRFPGHGPLADRVALSSCPLCPGEFPGKCSRARGVCCNRRRDLRGDALCLGIQRVDHAGGAGSPAFWLVMKTASGVRGAGAGG
jgi:putative peptidoglycan lipid II flippase